MILMRRLKNISTFFFYLTIAVLFFSCGSITNKQNTGTTDSLNKNSDSMAFTVQKATSDTVTGNDTSYSKNINTETAALKPKVEVHYFHVTDRCAACIAIEDVTRKTLTTYYKSELANGTIIFSVLNVDDDENKAISEKYQAFGSSLFVTKIFNGKETTTDLTGDGFKYAKNKEDKFIGILKETLDNALKP
jgi:hypothetical protein